MAKTDSVHRLNTSDYDLPNVEWLYGNVQAWQAIHQRFGVLRMPIVNARTGHLLSDPTELQALLLEKKAGGDPPNNVTLWYRNWMLDAQVVELDEADEPLVCAILSGGVDRALFGKLRDANLIDILLDTSEKSFDDVALLGVDEDEFRDILDALTGNDHPTPPRLQYRLQDDLWGVPTLDPSMQALEALPMTKWGRKARESTISGMVHFYTDDYKFSALVTNPDALVSTGTQAAVEVNFSTSPDMPRAIALYQVYQKRKLARMWQEYGIQIAVDMNVDRRFFDLNFLGVPLGWKAYVNRAYSADLDHLVEAWQLATLYAGGDVVYTVYGGKQARELCERYGWRWHPEDSDTARGRTWDAAREAPTT